MAKVRRMFSLTPKIVYLQIRLSHALNILTATRWPGPRYAARQVRTPRSFAARFWLLPHFDYFSWSNFKKKNVPYLFINLSQRLPNADNTDINTQDPLGSSVSVNRSSSRMVGNMLQWFLMFTFQLLRIRLSSKYSPNDSQLRLLPVICNNQSTGRPLCVLDI